MYDTSKKGEEHVDVHRQEGEVGEDKKKRECKATMIVLSEQSLEAHEQVSRKNRATAFMGKETGHHEKGG